MISTVEKVLFLKSIDLFRALPSEELAQIAEIAEEQPLASGDQVFGEGEPGDALYLIVEGKVKVHKGTKELVRLGVRDVFGEMAVLDSEPRSASVTAVEDAVCLKIGRDDFRDILSERPEIAMGVMKVLTRRLRETSKKIGTVDSQILDALPLMFEIMYKARGIGLAGPQAGLGRRIGVANLSGDPKKKDEEQVFINPEILGKSGNLREEEGCLSLPGMAALMLRAEKVLVRYQDLKGKWIEREVEMLESRLFQHEIDHLDGILIVDKMTPADRKQWAALLKEMEEDFKADRKPKRRPSPRPATAP